MSWATELVNFSGPRVAVRTTRPEDVAEIAAAIFDPGGWYHRQWSITSQQEIVALLANQIAERPAGTVNPLVYRVLDRNGMPGEVAGITRYMRIDPANKCLEIGGTWVAPKWRRTFVNSEVKRALLEHCIEILGAIRVEFRVHVENLVSQKAVTRMGATLEGKLRHRQIAPDGRIADGLIYSVIAPEWPAVKDRLLTLVAR